MKDYYKILGVSSEVDMETIKMVFREKVSLLHPEKNKADNAKEKFADLIEAYEILSKPENGKHMTLYSKKNNRMYSLL